VHIRRRLRALRTVGEITLGDDVLITGASGGVGMAAIQVAKASGARARCNRIGSEAPGSCRRWGDEVLVAEPGALHEKVRALAPPG